MKSIDELLARKDSAEELREKFFGALLRKPTTRKQAWELLEKYGASELAERLMREAEESGLVDDEAYARLFADGHLQWGNLKIAHELRMRGVDGEDIAAALDEAESESKRAREIAEGWRKSGVEDRKIQSRLLSRGFTNRAVRYALSRKDDRE